MSSEYERVIKSGEHFNVEHDATIIGWKIYYNDGSIISSRNSTWNDAKSTDIIVVTLFQAQTFPIFVNGIKEFHNYRILLDEGKYFWRQIIDTVETFGQCESTDSSIPINPRIGEIKTWNGGSDFQKIYNNAYLDNKW